MYMALSGFRAAFSRQSAFTHDLAGSSSARPPMCGDRTSGPARSLAQSLGSLGVRTRALARGGRRALFTPCGTKVSSGDRSKQLARQDDVRRKLSRATAGFDMRRAWPSKGAALGFVQEPTQDSRPCLSVQVPVCEVHVEQTRERQVSDSVVIVQASPRPLGARECVPELSLPYRCAPVPASHRVP